MSSDPCEKFIARASVDSNGQLHDTDPSWSKFEHKIHGPRWSKMVLKVSVVQAHPQSPDEMIVTVGLFVTGSAFPLWASAHLAQMATWMPGMEWKNPSHADPGKTLRWLLDY